ncbi:hypothetical protein QJS04_geneDACA022438 [Acorus gramineus]|uniref:Uncharacterized protein n=1 Tax=Acorus gramineus TaxID=55184 RepID=A0AAV9AND0_ACOGR|nr:hypothetical protein QJS04_geneDACA022438 [Acorus gramineus]
MEVSAKMVLPDVVIIETAAEGRESFPIVYDWKPRACSHCHTFRHDDALCSKRPRLNHMALRTQLQDGFTSREKGEPSHLSGQNPLKSVLKDHSELKSKQSTNKFFPLMVAEEEMDVEGNTQLMDAIQDDAEGSAPLNGSTAGSVAPFSQEVVLRESSFDNCLASTSAAPGRGCTRGGVPTSEETLNFGVSFHVALEAIGRFGSGLAPPSMHEISETCLQEENALRTLMVADEWTKSKWCNLRTGKQTERTILSVQFWKGVQQALHAGIPLVHVLRLVDGDEKPSMGYLYNAMDRAKEKIKENYQYRPLQYGPVIEVIEGRWSRQMSSDLYHAGFVLNPGVWFKTADRDAAVQTHMLRCVQAMAKMEPDPEESGPFSWGTIVRARDNTIPVNWWDKYGGEHMNNLDSLEDDNEWIMDVDGLVFQGARRRGKRPIIEEPEDEDDDDDEEDEVIPATQFQGQEGVESSDETRDVDNEIQEEDTDSDDNNGGHGGNDGGGTSYGYGTPLGGTHGGVFVTNAMDYLFK